MWAPWIDRPEVSPGTFLSVGRVSCEAHDAQEIAVAFLGLWLPRHFSRNEGGTSEWKTGSERGSQGRVLELSACRWEPSVAEPE